MVVRHQHPGARHTAWPAVVAMRQARCAGGARNRVRQVDLRRLPPSSGDTRLTVGAAWVRILRPATVEPVNETMSTAGWLVSNSAPAVPASTTTLSTPGGSPAASAAAPKISDEIGVSGLGRRITELPAISAGMSFWKPMISAAL